MQPGIFVFIYDCKTAGRSRSPVAYINRFSEEKKKEYEMKCFKMHQKKLWNLGLDISAMYLENTSTICNLSARFVTDSEKKLLSKGLDFAILKYS